jgi:hypothetical protein
MGMFTRFAHSGVNHSKGTEAASHSLPLLIAVSLAVAVVALAAYLLLNRRPARQEQEDKNL